MIYDKRENSAIAAQRYILVYSKRQVTVQSIIQIVLEVNIEAQADNLVMPDC